MLESAVTAGRVRAESLMQDFGVMRRPTGHATQNADGEEVPTFADVFSSRCKIQGSSTGGSDPAYRTVTVGGVERDLISAGLHLPIGVATASRGWVFEVTAAGPLSDPRIIGRRYYVHNDPAASLKTARRLDVAEV